MKQFPLKSTLTAALVLAITLTFSCSSGGGSSGGGGGGDDDPSSSSGVSSSSSGGGGDIGGSSSSSSDATASSSSSSDIAVSSSSVDSGVSSSSIPTECTSWSAWTTTPATCIAEGLKTRNCTSGITKTETEAIAMLVWGDWEIETPASGTTPAKGKRTCPNGDVDREDMAVCGTGKLPFAPAEEFCQDGVVKELCGTAKSTYTAAQFCQAGTDEVLPLCGTATYTATQRCGASNVVQTKCGSSLWYDASNTNLRCQSEVIETKCGSSWYDASNTNLQCQSNVVVTKCGTSWYDASNANLQCQSNVVVTKCGTSWYDASNANLQCQSNVVQTKCGSSLWYDASTQFCYNSSKVGNLCGNRTEHYDPDLYECRAGTNPNGIYLKAGITDSRDGTSKTYAAVLIGTQTWMAENLNYETSDGSSKCYSNNTANCDTYGRLYDWSTAMANSASSTANPSGVQGVCPSGWHLPSDAEWGALMQFVNPGCRPTDNCAGAGTKLKASSGWNSSSGIPAGTDDYGFSALPGGYGDSGGYFNRVGDNGYWWSASANSSDYAYYRLMLYNYEYADYYYNTKFSLFSVRCLQG